MSNNVLSSKQSQSHYIYSSVSLSTIYFFSKYIAFHQLLKKLRARNAFTTFTF